MFTIEVFLVVFIFILFVLVSIEDIKTAFLLLLMLIPLQHKELFSLVVWDIIPIRIAFFGIFLSSFYRLYLWFRRYKKKDVVLKFIKDPILIILSSLFIIRAFSIIYSPLALDTLKLLAFFSVMVFFYSLMRYIYLKEGLEFIKKSVFVYVLLSFFMGVISIVQFISFKFYKIKFGAIWDIPTHNPRIGSTFWDVNHFGAFVASAIPISIALALYKKGLPRLFFIFNSFFLCLVLYLTQSRSAWMGFAFAMGISVLLLIFKGYKKYAIILFTTTAFLVVILLSYFEIFYGSVAQKYKQFMHTRLDSFDTHFILVRGAYEAYSKNPIFGEGYGAFNEAFRETSFADEYFFREREIKNSRVPSHSIWGEVITETGFIGLSTYLLLFFTIFILLYRGFIKGKNIDSFLSLGFIASIATLLISGIFYTYNMEFFWYLVFAGAIVALDQNKDLNINSFFRYLKSLKLLPSLFISIFSAFLIFWDLGKNKLIDWDEAIYAEIAKNVVKTGDLFTFYWTIGAPWFEKPPLFIWMTSFFMWAFGPSEITARITSSILGFIGVITVYFFAKYLFKSRFSAVIASLSLITTAHYWYYSRIGMMDVSVSVFILLSLFFYYKFVNDFKFTNVLLSGFFVGCAVLTKAIVGLLPFGVIGIYSICLLIFYRKDIHVKKYISGVFILFFTSLLIFIPWHIVELTKHGQNFWGSYFLTHMLGRGLTDAQGKTQNFLWYIDVCKISLRAWFIVLFPVFTVTDKSVLLLDKYNIVAEDSWILNTYSSIRYFLLLPVPLFLIIKNKFKVSKEYLFLSIYFLVVFLFFSYSKSKLVWYIIPIYPAYSLIISGLLRDFILFIFNRIKKITKIEYSSYVSFITIFVCLFMFVYIVSVQDKVFYGDFNKDIAKVTGAYNELYYNKKDTKVEGLHYLRIDTPAIRFYTEGKIFQIDIEAFDKKIKSAKFDENLIYLSRRGEVSYFVGLYGDDKVTQNYNSGAIYLMRVRSGEEYYLYKIAQLNEEISAKFLVINSPENIAEKAKILLDINNNEMKLIYEYEKVLNQNMPLKYALPFQKKYVETAPNLFTPFPAN
ncbi:glycosyltransferase family 39 protein [Patescibacteria group bacterium]|nr:glycosyltransferase family 39 protein [Patescibacteria group bacterium]